MPATLYSSKRNINYLVTEVLTAIRTPMDQIITMFRDLSVRLKSRLRHEGACAQEVYYSIKMIATVAGESSHEWRGRTDTPLIQTANLNIYRAYLAKL